MLQVRWRLVPSAPPPRPEGGGLGGQRRPRGASCSPGRGSSWRWWRAAEPSDQTEKTRRRSDAER
eukprot:1314343-Pyramimonas_sp.AAC.1